MTATSTPQNLPISADHVRRQFDRHARDTAGEFLHGEIANRMFDRLKLIRIQPETLLDAGCGIGHRTTALRNRFPAARLISLDHNPRLLALLRKTHQLDGLGQWIARLRNTSQHTTLCADLAATTLPAESLDLVWSNLALHWHPAPHAVIQEWGRIIKPDGLAFFSCYGPGTGIELRHALADADLKTATMPFVDMHDLGDMLVEHGFADPVMDQETLTLTYASPEALINDVKLLGGNANPHRQPGLAGKGWINRLKRALQAQAGPDGRLKLTVEVSYGHAWRQAIRHQGTETLISLHSLKRPSPPRQR